ncbi:5509_t:CDS:2, partial [Paraglomus brasilianum]
ENKTENERKNKRKNEFNKQLQQCPSLLASTSKQEMSDVQLLDSVQMETKDVTIGELKKTIKVLLPGMFANVDTKDLVMWRVNILKDNEEKIEQLQNNEKTIEESGGIKIKHMTKQVGEMFGTPALGSIHIIVECP